MSIPNKGVRSFAEEVRGLFQGELQCLTNGKDGSKPNHIDLQYIHSALALSEIDLGSCIKLIEGTSGDDYRASSIGWNPKSKMEEMKDEEMMYILIREGINTRKRRLSAQIEAQEHTRMKRSCSTSLTKTAEEIDCSLDTKISGVSVAANEMSDEDASTHTEPEASNILGFISFMFTKDDPPYEDRDVLYVYEIHMKEVLRGNGLGSKLISFVERAARICEISKTMLTVFKVNEKARALYEKLGYSKDACSPEDRVIRKRVIEADYIIMSKELG